MKFNLGLLLVFLAFLLIAKLSASSYPEKLSKEALISIVNVDYKNEKSIFSKAVLRFYDKNTDFDEVIDFSYFENFEDSLFHLKFYFLGGRAKIISVPFFDFSEKELDINNASISEIILNLTYTEISYIFNFLKNMHVNLPDYDYDFDLEKNNSFTHISAILNDTNNYLLQLTNNCSFFNYSRNLNLSWKKKNDKLPIRIFSSKDNFFDSDLKSFSKLSNVSFSTIISFSIIASVIFLYTIYQTLVIFFKRFYSLSIFKTIQSLDFLILFISGVVGTIILLQDYFSSQSLFKNNFHFLYLFPFNIVMSFNVYHKYFKDKFLKIYWILIPFLEILYISVSWIFSKEFLILDFLIAIPLFIRSVYFEIVLFLSKKNPAQKPDF